MRFVSQQESAKLQYTRLLWKRPLLRQALVSHWTEGGHPYRKRFLARRTLIEMVLESTDDDRIDREFRQQGTCLNEVAKDIPSVFGDALVPAIEMDLASRSKRTSESRVKS